MKRFAVLALSALAVAAAGAEAISAHTLLSSGWTYTDGSLCVLGSAAAQHPPAGGYSGASVESYNNYHWLGCSGNRDKPPGHLLVRRQWYKWNGSAWYVCNDSGNVRNATTTWTISHQRTFTTAICGSGWYGTQAYGVVYENVGGWRGGSVWSGAHYLPA